MFVLIISRGYPTEKYIGNGIFEFDQAKALAKAGCKVVLACVDLRSIRRRRKWGFERLLKDGIDIYAVNIPLGKVPHKLLSCFGRWGIKRLYKRIVAEHGKPDIIHAHFAAMADIAFALKPIAQSKYIVTAHDGYPKKPLWMQQVEKNIYPAYGCVIAVSDFVSQNLQELGVRTKVIYNMLDNIFISNYHKNRPLSEALTFVFVGSLEDHKHPLMCIEAFWKAFKSENFMYGQKRIKLNIIGNGVLMSKCQHLIHELGVDEHVHMLGGLLRKDIMNIFYQSNCFVLPSELETFGVVYIEAMASGLPVIATRCGGPEGFVDDTNGVLIPVNDEQALIDAFRYMRENIGKYDSTKIAEETVKKFSPEAVAKQLVELYEEMQKK